MPGKRQYGGQTERGNIDVTKRKRVQNDDGSESTLRSVSFRHNGSEVLVPSMTPEGKRLDASGAFHQYRESGKHLGKFKSPGEATAYAHQLSLHQGTKRK